MLEPGGERQLRLRLLIFHLLIMLWPWLLGHALLYLSTSAVF